ncbi:HNH endonuclease [Haloterrigena salifodinae]|uniref:HNH endonuclease n=1 Tax=Haloterrigena salifodinae TaxID=2675099 RepID=UPI000F88861F|nr:HNH endonuclease [Haloterrigena salifodinae]
MATEIYLTPCSKQGGGSRAYHHLQQTVLDGVHLEDDRVPAANQNDEKISVWGVTEGNYQYWKQLEQGNYLLFYVGDYKYEYVAEVIGTREDSELAEELWPDYKPGETGGNDPGDPWNYIIFLKSPVSVDIDSDEIHGFAGHATNYPQRFMSLNQQAHNEIRQTFGSLEEYFDARRLSFENSQITSENSTESETESSPEGNRSDHTLWLFNIRPVNWKRCVNGPPDNEVHSRHRSEPWHGLSSSVAWMADEMQKGDTALVRQSGHGIMGIWEITETVPVRTQKHHNWEGEYEQFIYCQGLECELENPVDDTEFFEGTDFVRFNLGANELNEADSKTFLTEIKERADLTEDASRRVDAELQDLGMDIASGPTTEGEESADRSSEEETDSGVVDQTERASDLKPPDRVKTKISRVIRNTTLTRQLKQLYDSRCQVCDDQRRQSVSKMYAEAHHIQPLGGSPAGPDSEENVLILCPNHHADFDYGMIEIDPESLKISHKYDEEINGSTLTIHEDHEISREFIQYHNKELSEL